MVSELGKLNRSSQTYICWSCGTGKTTSILELGHIIGLNSLSAKSKKTVTVRLVLANPDLVNHYKQQFA